MKIYLVSNSKVLWKNTGFITSSYLSYEDAFDNADFGQYIHEVDAQDVFEVRNAGKVAVKVGDGSTEQK